MKILIVNKFFYPRGGDCVVAINTQRLLESKGHKVRVFAMQYDKNLDMPETETFASEVNFSGGIKAKLKAFARVIGKGDVVTAFKKVLDDFKPDVVHLHNIHSYLSPIVGEMAHNAGARVVWTLHDYKLICPSYLCRRPDGINCEQCFSGNSMAVIANKCMKGSLPASVIAAIEAKIWNKSRLQRFTDKFIAPSRFMQSKMIKAGFDAEKIEVISNFVDPLKLDALAKQHNEKNRKNYYCYIGRLSAEKGVATMIEAAKRADVELRLAGDGDLRVSLEQKYEDCDNIKFLGHLSAEQVAELLKSAKASIMPSECYDNNPLGVIESLCCGTPVVGAKIGGIPELIGENDGVVFESANVDDLVSKFKTFDKLAFDNDKIAQRAIKKFSQTEHYDLLLKTYTDD